MKTLLTLCSWVLLVLLFAKHARAESEFAHAAERVLAYMLYRAEELADPRNNPKSYTIAPYCSDGLGRRCTFNEFITFIATGDDRSGKPHVPTTLNPANIDSITAVVNELGRNIEQNPMKPYVKPYLRAGLVARSAKYEDLYTRIYPELRRRLVGKINAMPVNDARREASAIVTLIPGLVKRIIWLRQAPNLIAVHKELTERFVEYEKDSTGREVKNKYYTHNVKTYAPLNPHLKPIQWVFEDRSFAGRPMVYIDFDKSKAATDPATWNALKGEITSIVKLVHEGKGKKLTPKLIENIKSARSHKFVLDNLKDWHVKLTPGVSYPDSCENVPTRRAFSL